MLIACCSNNLYSALFKARIKHINGAPAENVPVRVSAVTEANAPIPNESEVTRSSDEDGRIEHTFNVPGGIQQMKITVGISFYKTHSFVVLLVSHVIILSDSSLYKE